MLAAARSAMPEASFILRDIKEDLSDIGTFDLVFSNAVLQWLPDTVETAARLLDRVNSGGALAVQVPACAPLRSGEGRLETGDAHRMMLETAMEAEFSRFTEGAGRLFDFCGEQFYERLSAVASGLSLWETRYCHELDGYQGLVEWYRGTGMRPYLDALPDDFRRNRFQARFMERVAEDYPLTASGKLLFWFRRLFFVAYKA
jgi:trans-aconitate 2-methyltransferase